MHQLRVLSRQSDRPCAPGGKGCGGEPSLCAGTWGLFGEMSSSFSLDLDGWQGWGPAEMGARVDESLPLPLCTHFPSLSCLDLSTFTVGTESRKRWKATGVLKAFILSSAHACHKLLIPKPQERICNDGNTGTRHGPHMRRLEWRGSVINPAGVALSVQVWDVPTQEQAGHAAWAHVPCLWLPAPTP